MKINMKGGITLLEFQCGNLNGVPSIVTKCLGNGNISYKKLIEGHQGWQAYAKWANSFKLRENIAKKI